MLSWHSEAEKNQNESLGGGLPGLRRRPRQPAPSLHYSNTPATLPYITNSLYFMIPATHQRPFLHFEPFRGKSSQVTFHEQLTISSNRFQSGPIRANQAKSGIFFEPSRPSFHRSNTLPVHSRLASNRANSTLYSSPDHKQLFGSATVPARSAGQHDVVLTVASVGVPPTESLTRNRPLPGHSASMSPMIQGCFNSFIF
jgi:hypothetical protein